MTSIDLEALKIELREEEAPFFSEKQLEYYVQKNDGDMEAVLYECLLIKAENTTLSVSGLSTTDTSKYFKMLAQKHRKSNTGILL